MRLLPLAVVVVLAGCTPEEGPVMLPGQDCLRCHGGSPAGTQGLEVRPARAWSLAGTVYATADAGAGAGVEGAAVKVSDSNGFSFELRTNQAGNFYSAERVVFPLRVCVSRSGVERCMQQPAPHGACNACHASPPLAGTAGRIATEAPPAICPPGIQATFSSLDHGFLHTSCLACHAGAQAASSGGLDLSGDAYAALVNVTAQNSQAVPASRPAGLLRVKPGDPEGSLLYQKLLIGTTPSPAFGEGMPLGNPGAVCQQIRDAVRQWIANGAPND